MPPRLPCIAPGLWNRLAYPAAFLKPGFSQKCQFDGPNLAVDNFTPESGQSTLRRGVRRIRIQVSQ